MLDWFANLWEIDKGEYWGYVTTGGTEGNLHGILTGSDLLNFISRAFSCITNSEYPKYNYLLINSHLLYIGGNSFQMVFYILHRIRIIQYLK